GLRNTRSMTGSLTTWEWIEVVGAKRETILRSRGLKLRLVAALLESYLVPYWLLFGFANFIFAIGGPETDHEFGRAHERALVAGLGLAAISFISLFGCAGTFGHGWDHRVIAGLLIAGIAVATIWVYPRYDL